MEKKSANFIRHAVESKQQAAKATDIFQQQAAMVTNKKYREK